MREHVYDGKGGPFDAVPDAPDDCVVCNTPLPENTAGEVTGYDNDGCTCSEPCHAVHLQRDAAHRAAEKVVDDALAKYYAEEAAIFPSV